MTFTAIIRADILQDALAPVSALVSECKFRCNDAAAEITAVDPANVGMIDMEIDASAFASYTADGEVLGLNLDRFEEILGMAESEEFVELELDEETRKLNIQIGGLSFTQALIDPESIRAEPDIPDLDLAGTFVFEAGELSRAVKAADLVGDHVAIVGESDDELRFEAQGDTDDVEVSVTGDDLLSGRLDGDAPQKSLFSLDYLSDMQGPMDSNGEISLRLGDEFPIKLRYSFADGDVSVLNLLAPRIQSD